MCKTSSGVMNALLPLWAHCKSPCAPPLWTYPASALQCTWIRFTQYSAQSAATAIRTQDTSAEATLTFSLIIISPQLPLKLSSHLKIQLISLSLSDICVIRSQIIYFNVLASLSQSDRFKFLKWSQFLTLLGKCSFFGTIPKASDLFYF